MHRTFTGQLKNLNLYREVCLEFSACHVCRKGILMKSFFIRVTTAAFLSLVLAAGAAAQVNSAIGGTVEDASKALIPGVSVTAVNTQTGVSTKTVSNESGV